MQNLMSINYHQFVNPADVSFLKRALLNLSFKWSFHTPYHTRIRCCSLIFGNILITVGEISIYTGIYIYITTVKHHVIVLENNGITSKSALFTCSPNH